MLDHLAPLGLGLLALLDLGHQGVPFVAAGHPAGSGYLSCKQGPGHGVGIAAEDDVGTAAGHVRGDGHRVLAPGLGDDLGLALVMLGVEHFVLDAPLVEQAGDQFALLDRHGADQDRPPVALDLLDLLPRDRFALFAPLRDDLDRVVVLANDLSQDLFVLVRQQHVPAVHPFDFIGQRVEFFRFGAVDHVGMVRCAAAAGWSGWRSRRACRSSRIRRLRSWPCRSCRRSCRRA